LLDSRLNTSGFCHFARFQTGASRPPAVHSPTLIALAAILAALVTAVLHLVWRFNKHIPGLGF
jgi:hypothetical protein